MFDERKVAQMAAYLLANGGGTMSHLKLIKLMYLADRESMARYGMPISGDCPVAMPHGPVLSRTLDLMNGFVKSGPGGWESLISDKINHELALRRSIHTDELDELSPADLEVLSTVWGQFGGLDQWQLVSYTHAHCLEWRDPHGSSHPIPFSRIFTNLGRSEEEARELGARIDSERSLGHIFASL